MFELDNTLSNAVAIGIRKHTQLWKNDRYAPPASDADLAFARKLADKHEAYGAWLHKEGFSAHSIRRYLSDTNYFLGYLFKQRHVFPNSVENSQEAMVAVADYTTRLSKRQLKQSSINSIITSIQHFYRYLGLDARFDRGTYTKPALSALSMEEEISLVSSLDRLPVRDAAIIMTLLDTGIRLNELVDLRIEDLIIDEHGNAELQVAGRQTRRIPVSLRASEYIKDWLAQRHVLAKDPTNVSLFISVRGTISVQAVDLCVRTAGERVSVRASASILRNTCIARWLDAQLTEDEVATRSGLSAGGLSLHVEARGRAGTAQVADNKSDDLPRL